MIKQELENLKQMDLYSLILFSLYKMIDIPEYSSTAELAYVLDKENLLNLCEYFGGQTIKIPTLQEIESLTYSLLLFQYVNIEGMNYEEAISLIGHESKDLREIKSNYEKLMKVLSKYEFKPRERV
jgi:hypothetical protein